LTNLPIPQDVAGRGHRPAPLKAYEDIGFLKSDACRTARLQLEFLKPEVAMQEQRIESTIVLFGSARLLPPEVASAELASAEKAAAAEPGSATAAERLRVARAMAAQSHYYTEARKLAQLASRFGQSAGCPSCKLVVITGGGGGIMEAGNRGAHDVGAKSIGLNITLPHEQYPNPYSSDELTFQFHYFSIRKMHFLMRARALCAFPGGFGTLDELFETLTLIQTGKIKPIPVVLFGKSFWEKVVGWQELADRGMICPGDLELFTICETADEGWAKIREFYRQAEEAE
jgi:uncharacterized protein (TIGR00730 family)